MTINVIFQVSLLDWDDQTYVAKYNNFYVASEKNKYRLQLSGYDSKTSNLPDAFASGGQANAMFSTVDEDNDSDDASNCAQQFSGGIIYQ